MSTTRLAVTGIAFLVIVVSGLSLGQKPYNTLVFTVHKLVAIGLIIFLSVALRQMHHDMALNTLEIGLVVLAGLLFLATVVTGGAVSIPDTDLPPAVKTVHHVAPYLTALSTVGALLMLVTRR